MNKVIAVKPLEDYFLQLTFIDNEVKFFDVKPYLNKGIFQELKEIKYFNSVTLHFDSIIWPNGQDFSPETLYIRSYSSIELV